MCLSVTYDNASGNDHERDEGGKAGDESKEESAVCHLIIELQKGLVYFWKDNGEFEGQRHSVQRVRWDIGSQS